MAKQSLLWTALPNGYTEDRKRLRLSLLLSPRLAAEADPQRLSTFPDFVDWPAMLSDAKFEIHFGATTVSIAAHDTTSSNRIDTRLGTPHSSVWKALFPDPDEVFVEGYKFRDLSDNKVLSFSAVKMDELVRDLYKRLAATAEDQLPTATKILAIPAWNDFVSAVDRYDHDDRFMDYRLGMRDPRRQFAAFMLDEFKSLPDPIREIALFQLFHTPPSTPRIERYDVPSDDPKSHARWLGYEQTKLPKPADFQSEIDFHQIITAMNQYPTLLRLLGLVVDVLIARDAFNPTPSGLLRAEVRLPSGSPEVTRTPDSSPRTRAMLDTERFQALPRTHPQTGDYNTVDGLLDLNPPTFSVVQADVDGGGLKVTNFARTLAPLQQAPVKRIDPTTKHEREIGAPALRNAGLMLVHSERGAMLKNSFERQKKYNTAAEKIQSGPQLPPPSPILFAEDLVRGWRIDIWDNKTKVWHSLCRRTADYDFNKGEVVINVPEEEGSVRLAATKSPDPSNNANLIWLHEALVSWTGWSLCAPPPGKTIHHHREKDPLHPELDHTDPVGEPEAEVPPGLHLQSTFRAVPGSLPRLRYGRKYWLRARVVDLAGNSLPVTEKDFGPENPSQNASAYFRYEPVSAPALALVKPTPTTIEAPAEGESMDRMAVRTFNEVPADNIVPSAQTARRFAVPSRTSHREAEYHGKLDRNGIVDSAFFAILASQDNSLAEEKILSAGPLAQVEEDEEIEVATVETRYAVMQEGEALPYLPEPLAVEFAARIFDHPNIAPDKVIRIPVYAAGTVWPEAAPFKIELYENPGDKPHFDEDVRTLRIPLPKALRSTLRLSVKPTKAALELLGVWNWLTQAQKDKLERLVLTGQHWMLTPWRNIELVHAVQKPLITPDIQKHTIDRGLASTFALPNFVTTCSIKSTDHMDLLALWNEPDEDGKGPSGKNRARDDHAFKVKITEPKYYAGNPEYLLEGPDLVRAGGRFHNRIEEKIHEFNDTRYRRIEYRFEATTAFREFMTPALLTTEEDGKTKTTDEHIKVTGQPLRTWIPSSAPPPAPEVLYVVPTFGWVRSHDTNNKSSWRRGGGLRVYLNRPWNVSGYGEMLAVVLPPASFKQDPNIAPAAQPLKNFVTQWGNDPIWLSPFVPGAAPKRSNFPLARTAADPAGKWLPSFAPVEEADQPPGPFAVAGLAHPEILPNIAQQVRVEIAPHDIFYDEERQLWYCDIEVNWGSAYYPFMRLALARYQPVSVPGAHLSNIVLADFMALVPDRWLNVTQAGTSRTRRVSVFGPTYTDSSGHTEAESSISMSVKLLDGTTRNLEPAQVSPSSVVEVWVERFYPALGEDFGWKRESGAVVQRNTRSISNRLVIRNKATTSRQRVRAEKLFRRRDFEMLVKEKLLDKLFIIPPLWEGTVTLPLTTADNISYRYRLAIAEYEEYLVDDTEPYDQTPSEKDRRLVFIEHVELD